MEYVIGFVLFGLTVLFAAAVTHHKEGWYVFSNADIEHPSTRIDALLMLTKRGSKLLLAFPAALGAVAIGEDFHDFLFRHGVHQTIHHGAGYVAGFAVSLILMNDFTFYWYHRALHSNKYLWELHKVHHSAERMTGITTERTHPIDDFMYYAFNGALSGLVYGAWLMVMVPPATITLFGVSVFMLVKIFSFGYLQHWHFKLSFGWFNRILVSPQYHHLHHSVDPVHYNSNYGTLLMVWDYMFGTVQHPKPNEDFQYGLQDDEAREYHSLRGAFLSPLVKIGRLIRQAWAGTKGGGHGAIDPRLT
jgi:sterol desaturase/sphingolipid hydroxylase (fatty acid hydroxylase superfamily)